ncbi:ribose-phosphate pyrophosphokinase [Massilia sp. TS11]|uniref:ribose-phosphate pyrophosphokinase n=1 Tax=Massilia sp. TS11 TaxID=2908003 RepID=UPI001EDBE794|nr:ribose-phosphate pyrophosphokinase [Massilia sp. TS11]MCG2584540.1 ribose-phosphate pyrophosphokinase [Massilia sp. TS11]
MTPMLFALPGNETMCARLAEQLGWDTGALETRRFPDGESYLRFADAVRGREVVLVCTLDRPDDKAISLVLAAGIARENGATRVGLVAPYLAYMRQDAVFKPGEGITSGHFARLLSGAVDWMVTIDPHLHRHATLDEIYTIPTLVVKAAPSISAWIARELRQPVIVGPDGESEQWAAEVARDAGCAVTVLTKTRHGDHDVEVSVPDTAHWQGFTTVLVDDIASTARTMIAAAGHITAAGLAAPVCIAVHPVFAGSAYADLQAAGVSRIVSCNTIAHPSNAIDLSAPLAAGIRTLHARLG